MTIKVPLLSLPSRYLCSKIYFTRWNHDHQGTFALKYILLDGTMTIKVPLLSLPSRYLCSHCHQGTFALKYILLDRTMTIKVPLL
nr:hypothetical protein Cduv_259 [Cedratvirus duvanny]